MCIIKNHAVQSEEMGIFRKELEINWFHVHIGQKLSAVDKEVQINA